MRQALLVLATLLISSLAAAATNAPTSPPTAVQKPAAPAALAAVKEEDGKYFDAYGNPTYKISPHDSADWYTFSGYRRFNGACEVCHGFDGSGSSFAPDLTQSLKSLTYDQFQKIVVGGKKDVNTAQTLVMPAFGDNKNVICYLDDIYVYLRARADGAQGPGRPASNAPKPKAATDYENECMGP